jgi:hypothetical protein
MKSSPTPLLIAAVARGNDMKIEADNPLVGYAFAIVATITSIVWLVQRLNEGSGFIAGLLWLATVGTYITLRILGPRR